MLKSLNKASGNLRGVKGFVEIDTDEYEPVSTQGWVIWNKKGSHKFNIYFHYSGKLSIELQFTKQALINMLAAIVEKESAASIALIGPDYDYLDEVIKNNPVAYWHLDDTGDTATTVSIAGG